MSKIPSETYRRYVAKKIVKTTMGQDVTRELIAKMEKEIDEAKTLTCDPDQIIADHEAGFVSTETASTARGYPKGEVEQAKKDHAERLKRIMEAQGGPQNASAARGANDFGGATSKNEKAKKQKRGTADKVIKNDE